MKHWPPISPKNILLKMPNWLGDLVMATAAVADIRKHFPDAKISALCLAGLGPLLKNDPNIDEVLTYTRPSGWIHRFEHYDLIQDIRQGEFDLGILFTNSFTSAYWFWRGQVKERLGFQGNLRSCLLTKAEPFPKAREQQHLVTTYKELLKPLGVPLSATSPSLYLTDEEKQSAKELLVLKGIPGSAILLGINPGAAYGSAKCWLPERFVAVSQKLLANDQLYIVYFGDQAGASLVDAICKELPTERVINLSGKTSLRELMALIASCSLFLTNDSGPMHMAAALKIPLVALFGSTNDTSTGPYGGGKVIHKHVECSPCYKRVCPIDFRCMKQISVEEVYQELEKLVKDPAHKQSLS
ncbi:MAG: lipopolysaccharide heptosyltransferase II [Parachlamydiaceae bacterium]|nr:lipopolysaccharide heptosyltransferase II [Parachlamydiaceae bacterium]